MPKPIRTRLVACVGSGPALVVAGANKKIKEVNRISARKPVNTAIQRIFIVLSSREPQLAASNDSAARTVDHAQVFVKRQSWRSSLLLAYHGACWLMGEIGGVVRGRGWGSASGALPAPPSHPRTKHEPQTKRRAECLH